MMDRRTRVQPVPLGRRGTGTGSRPCIEMRFAIAAIFFLAQATTAIAEDLPAIPVGLDAYRQWDKWPLQRIGVRASMRSTYDRSGRNEGADASHFLCQRADDFNVTLDVEGRGILYFARYNHWHGSPWHYVVDGRDTIVQESSSANPEKPVENSTFEPRDAFPKPLAWTWSDTKGADLSWVPIGFEKSFQMAYSRTRYGTGYYIYHQFMPGIPLSQPIQAWDGKTPPAAHLLRQLDRASDDKYDLPPGKQTDKLLEFSGQVREQWIEVDPLENSGGMIRRIVISAPRSMATDLEQLRIVAQWDDLPSRSIDAPLPLFFGAGTLYNRDDREYLVAAFPVKIAFDKQRIHFKSFFPMPFRRKARIGLVAPPGMSPAGIGITVRQAAFEGNPQNYAYFHATYRDHPNPERGKDLVLLDTRETDGNGDWSGSFIGTSFIFSHNANLTTLEGDPRFYFDDSESPQAYGTGTEEWGGGGDYWGGQNMTLPFAGHPTGAKSLKDAKSDLDRIESAYRFLLADLMPFGNRARITLEHGGENESTEHYETVTYWYGSPHATLAKTDELTIGEIASETSHDYHSPAASAPYEIRSRYELGVDAPELARLGRKTAGTSEFTLKLDPKNEGVLLRRTLDYAFANQRAEVSVADIGSDDFKPAGVWYLAGSDTCVYSNPKTELGATQHNVQRSNRRFRDDEFLVARHLTRGRDKVRVRVKFTPVQRPLFPGHPLAELAWSEIRYVAYCYVLPKAEGNP